MSGTDNLTQAKMQKYVDDRIAKLTSDINISLNAVNVKFAQLEEKPIREGDFSADDQTVLQKLEASQELMTKQHLHLASVVSILQKKMDDLESMPGSPTRSPNRSPRGSDEFVEADFNSKTQNAQKQVKKILVKMNSAIAKIYEDIQERDKIINL